MESENGESVRASDRVEEASQRRCPRGSLAAVVLPCARTPRLSASTAEFLYLDLTSLTSVRLFARTFGSRGLPLHLLVNNGAPLSALNLFCFAPFPACILLSRLRSLAQPEPCWFLRGRRRTASSSTLPSTTWATSC